MIEYINKRLVVGPKENFISDDISTNAEIVIHVSPEVFGTMGHCDICINDYVFFLWKL